MCESKAGVGLSRKWDAREAGREVAETALEKLDGEKPKFFLLFSTIHYEKYGGFQELLNGVWEVLPEGTPLIGGTVAGFMNNYGCFARGATALTVAYPNMDVAIGVGQNTKRNPRRAGRDCANMIRDKLKETKFPHKFILDVISGGIVPQIGDLGRRKVIRGVSSKVALSLLNISLTTLQTGVGREEEVLTEFTKYFDDWYVLHCSSMDDGKAISNYQFFNKEVGTNMIVAMGVCTDTDVDISSCNSLSVIKTFKVDKLSKDGRIIHRINGKPAAQEFLNLLGWPEEYLDEQLFKRTFFYPIGFKKEGKWFAEIIGIIAENSIVVLHKIEDKNMAILSASGENLMEAVKKSLSMLNVRKPSIGIISTCEGRLEALGPQIFIVREELLKYFGEAPFIALYCGGEAIKKPNCEVEYNNVTFSPLVMSEP